MDENDTGGGTMSKVVVGITTTLSVLAGALLFAEHDASARTISRSRTADRTTVTGFVPTAPPIVARPGPAVSQLLPPNATGADALLAGQQIANLIANQSIPGPVIVTGPSSVPGASRVSGISCPILLANRAFILSNFAFLSAQFPSQLARLIADRDAALAEITVRLIAQGCPVPSGVAP